MHTKNINSTASTNATLIWKGGIATRSVQCFNAGATAAYLKVYDTSVVPVVGTDIPVAVYAMPPNSNAFGYTGAEGIERRQGLGIAITALPADTDTTAVAAGQVKATIVFG